MAEVVPRTVGESLYWSYANLAMAFASVRHDCDTYQQVDYIVRNKTYYGLLRGGIAMGTFFIDQRENICGGSHCAYCGDEERLSLDHVIPRLRDGPDAADNLVTACRSCNSSKGSRDLLQWYASRGEFPPLVLLRRYLKLAVRYCKAYELMDYPLDWLDAAGVDIPFSLDLVPHEYPPPKMWIARISQLFDEGDE